MTRPGFIDGADDMMLDFEKIDAANRGQLTPYALTSIQAMASFGLAAKFIARQLNLSLEDVEKIRMASETPQPSS